MSEQITKKRNLSKEEIDTLDFLLQSISDADPDEKEDVPSKRLKPGMDLEGGLSWEKTPSADWSETATKYKSKLKFLKEQRNPITRVEKLKYYPPLEPEMYLKTPFEDELQEILEDDYYKFSFLIMEALDKSALGSWCYNEYLQIDLNLQNFESSVPDMETVLQYTYYIYSRIGDPIQYYNYENKEKLNLILELIHQETKNPEEITYVIGPKNNKKQKIQLIPDGLLESKTGQPLDNELIKRYKSFEIDLPNKDSLDSDGIPSTKEISLFPMKNIKVWISIHPTRIGQFVYTMIDRYFTNTSFIQRHDNRLIFPYEFDLNLNTNKKRFFITSILQKTHLNILIFDKQFQTIERFEPHGTITYEYFTKFVLKNKEFLTKLGFKNLITELEYNNFKLRPFYKDQQFRKLIAQINDFQKQINDEQLRLTIQTIELDLEISEAKFPAPYNSYQILLPQDYQIVDGPQSYYDLDFEIDLPTGLCVTFCFIYFCMRLRVNTREELAQLQLNINQRFFEFLLTWYQQNIDPNVEVDSTLEKEKKLFVKEAVVEFLMKANQKYLGKLLERINELFGTDFILTQGRNIII
jgi:hypothetical protein